MDASYSLWYPSYIIFRTVEKPCRAREDDYSRLSAVVRFCARES